MWDSKGGQNESDEIRRVRRGGNRVGGDGIEHQRLENGELPLDVLEDAAVIRRVPRSSMETAEMIHAMPSRRGIQ